MIITNALRKFDTDNDQIMDKSKQSLDQAEIEYLKEGLKRTFKERFEMATRLYKIQQTMNKASIVHKPFMKK